MKSSTSYKLRYFIAVTFGIASLVAVPVYAMSSTPVKVVTSTAKNTANVTASSSASSSSSAASSSSTTNTQSTAATATANTAHVNRIIARGNAEIDRRLATLKTLTARIADAKHLTASDATTLSGRVSADITELTTLKSALDADTTVAAATTDAQSIINNYRVYALLLPQIQLVRTADHQLSAAGKLSQLVSILNARITADQTAGKNVATLAGTVNAMATEATTAASTSDSVEMAVIPLLPTDYDNDHTILSGYRDKLEAAQADLKTASTDASTVITALQSLK